MKQSKGERLLHKNKELDKNREIVRENFLTYLRTGFPYKMHWQHPLTGEVHNYKAIEQGVISFRRAYPEQYKVLWAIWMSPERWRVICEAYGVPPTRHKHYLECAVDHILLLLYHPDLAPEGVHEAD
jgi:spore coat polysaccharide biosynthesis protein SpsF (cytidylyltransferase family)